MAIFIHIQFKNLKKTFEYFRPYEPKGFILSVDKLSQAQTSQAKHHPVHTLLRSVQLSKGKK